MVKYVLKMRIRTMAPFPNFKNQPSDMARHPDHIPDETAFETLWLCMEDNSHFQMSRFNMFGTKSQVR